MEIINGLISIKYYSNHKQLLAIYKTPPSSQESIQ